MAKIIKALLLAYNFVFILFIISSFLDPDFGWHLRFGKEWLEQGFFPYLESYTYTHLGQLWINHEWGGDLIYWLIYKNIGYYALVLATPFLIIGGFFVAQKIYQKKYTLIAAIVTTFLIWTTQHIFATRLAMVSLLFFAIFWYSVQNIEKIKLYRFWPLFFWLWAALHGSFTLGFIVIGIYFLGNLINEFFLRYYPPLSLGKSWKKETYLRVIFWTSLSLATILINPYGWHLIKEVVSYFFYDFYKLRISEWVSSNTFPIYWKTGLFMAPALVMAFYNFQKKIFSWGEFLLFCGLYYVSLKHKRQVIYLVIFCQPFFTAILEKAKNETGAMLKRQKILPDKRIAYFAFLFSGIVLLIQTFSFIPNIFLYKDVWPNLDKFKNRLPLAAVTYLNDTLKPDDYTKIFNEFSWGGYMNWVLPQGLLFLDGRGAATWKIHNSQKTSLEIYYELVYEENGLTEIEKQGVQYVILEDMTNYKPHIDKVNYWLFGEKALKKITEVTPKKLTENLQKSKNWQLIYNDGKANIWKFISSTPPEKE